ncbi:MAG: hypothetical protein R2848_09750 [Thermomicrobiales bacterium]
MDPFVQLAGALLVLLGYVLGQLGKFDPTSRSYLAVNFVGSALLAADAFDGQWGFMLLNGVWAAISLVNLGRAFANPSEANRAR